MKYYIWKTMFSVLPFYPSLLLVKSHLLCISPCWLNIPLSFPLSFQLFPNIVAWNYQFISGWWLQPLWRILVSWDNYSQYMESHKFHVPNYQPALFYFHYAWFFPMMVGVTPLFLPIFDRRVTINCPRRLLHIQTPLGDHLPSGKHTENELENHNF